jgi:hypothetical protein
VCLPPVLAAPAARDDSAPSGLRLGLDSRLQRYQIGEAMHMRHFYGHGPHSETSREEAKSQWNDMHEAQLECVEGC